MGWEGVGGWAPLRATTFGIKLWVALRLMREKALGMGCV